MGVFSGPDAAESGLELPPAFEALGEDPAQFGHFFDSGPFGASVFTVALFGQEFPPAGFLLEGGPGRTFLRLLPPGLRQGGEGRSVDMEAIDGCRARE